LTRAIGYCRVSTKDQKEHGTSIPDQREKIAKCCSDKGWQLIAILEDNQTGTKLEIRDGIQNILSRLDDWDVLVITKPDRLSRSFVDAEYMFKDIFEPKNKNVWSIEMGDNLTTHPELRQFKSIIADMEVRNIRSRSAQGFEYASRGGFWIGKAPFGYRTQIVGKSHKDRKRLTPDEDSELVNIIFKLASEGASHSEIAIQVPQVARTSIITILSNPIYYGFRKLSKREVLKDDSGLITSAKRIEWWVKHDYEGIVEQKYLDVCFRRYRISDKIGKV